MCFMIQLRYKVSDASKILSASSSSSISSTSLHAFCAQPWSGTAPHPTRPCPVSVEVVTVVLLVAEADVSGACVVLGVVAVGALVREADVSKVCVVGAAVVLAVVSVERLVCVLNSSPTVLMM